MTSASSIFRIGSGSPRMIAAEAILLVAGDKSGQWDKWYRIAIPPRREAVRRWGHERRVTLAGLRALRTCRRDGRRPGGLRRRRRRDAGRCPRLAESRASRPVWLSFALRSVAASADIAVELGNGGWILAQCRGFLRVSECGSALGLVSKMEYCMRPYRRQQVRQCGFRQAVVTSGGLAVSASSSLSRLRQRRRLLKGPREERDA